MNIKNFKYDETKKAFKNKMILTATLIGIIGLSMTGCVQKQDFKQLDINKVQTESTTIDERKEYYSELEKMIEGLSDNEYDKYAIDLKEEFEGAPADDTIMILRNDNVYKGVIKTSESKTKLSPGVYKVISLNEPDDESSFGEIELLDSGEEVTIKVDYNTYKVSISNHKAK